MNLTSLREAWTVGFLFLTFQTMTRIGFVGSGAYYEVHMTKAFDKKRQHVPG